jgi:putative ABC transport system permease protein
LLTVAVAASICNAAITYNLTPVAGNAEFGSVNHYIEIDASDSAAWRSDVEFAAEEFGTIDVITHRDVPVPGTTDTVDYRAQDPDGPYGKPMLDLREGRYPVGATEIALTDAVLARFGKGLGSTINLDGVVRTIVGVVENPSDLREEFALLDPEYVPDPQSVIILVDATFDDVYPFRAPSGATTTRSQRPASEDVDAAVGAFATATVAMVLIALVSAASFVAVAQRRTRQLGMLSAIGATSGLLRMVMLVNGLIVGGAAAVMGAVGGLLAWFVSIPLIEEMAGHRIDPLNLPLWLVAVGMILAIVTAVAAAAWPAWAIARVPTVQALSGRPPKSHATPRLATLAMTLTAIGIGCLAWADQQNALLTITGTVTLVSGALLLCPTAIRHLARPMTRLPIAIRLALRDLARYQARSGMALAAISLALGIAVTTVAVATAAEYSAREGNLGEQHIMIRIGDPGSAHNPDDFSPYLPERTAEQLAQLNTDIERLTNALGGTSAIPLMVAVDPAMPPEAGFDGRPAITLSTFVDLGEKPGWRDVTLVYVATSDVLALDGISVGTLVPESGILTVEKEQLRISNFADLQAAEPDLVTNATQITRTYSSLPGSFMSAAEIEARGWEIVSYGWVLESDAPLTKEQQEIARSAAVSSGFTVEFRDQQNDLAVSRTQATFAGTLLALAVLSMTVGLIRGEAAGDLRTLTATGATAFTRRTLTAATAGALALLGVIIGSGGAYAALIAWYAADVGVLSPLPVASLAAMGIGLPLVAILAGWILAGRAPDTVARQPID